MQFILRIQNLCMSWQNMERICFKKYFTACSTGSVQEVGWSGQLWAPVHVSIYHG